MRGYPRLRSALWITNIVFAGAAAWMVWSLSESPEHALEPKAPRAESSRKPIALSPVEVIAEPAAKNPRRRYAQASIIPSKPLTLPPVRMQGEGIPLPQTMELLLVLRGIDEEHVRVRLCLDARGVPVSSRVVASSGLAELEAYVRERVMRWRYIPLLVGGESAPSCTFVDLHYVLQS